MNDIGCTYIESIDDKKLYQSLKTKNRKKNFNLIFTNHILGSKLLKLRNNLFINKHSSLLPSYKGLLPFVWTKIFSAKNGVSFHLVSKKVDSGKIIYQRKINNNFKSMVEFYIHIYKSFPYDLNKSLINLDKKKFINSNFKKSIFSLPNKKEYKEFSLRGGRIIRLNDFLEINRITN